MGFPAIGVAESVDGILTLGVLVGEAVALGVAVDTGVAVAVGLGVCVGLTVGVGEGSLPDGVDSNAGSLSAA